ncbi:MAG: sulfotransferase [Planctomycetes bacterium]|nr:sulfotransferase [Planctomycetota bacterium]
MNDTQRSAAASSSEGLKVAFILGMGRSGTNFLLDLLDTSPTTHCRNEPDELLGGALESWSEWKIHSGLRGAEDLWPALQRAAASGGERDRRIPTHKTWLRSSASAPLNALSRAKLRKLLPTMSGAEYQLPNTLAQADALAGALHVLKVNAAPSVAEVFLGEPLSEAAPPPKVLHIVRNPAGFLRSWRRRWLVKHDEAEVFAANLARLQAVLKHDPEGSAFVREVQEPDVFEAELLFWRYCTQRIRAAGVGSQGYYEVSYDELAHAPLPSLRGVFDHLKLPWDGQLEARVNQMTGSSVNIADAYQRELDEDARARFERTLGPALVEEFSLKGS